MQTVYVITFKQRYGRKFLVGAAAYESETDARESEAHMLSQHSIYRCVKLTALVVNKARLRA